MSYISNRDLAHDFFYSIDGYKNPSRSSVSYKYRRFYSYSTAICRIFTRNDGAKVALFSEDTFTVTTAKHLSYLTQACPFDRYHVFFDYEGDASEKELINTNSRYLEQYSVAKLTQKANRETFATAFHALENFLNFAEFKPFYKDIKKVLKKYQNIKDALDNKESLKALNKKRIESEKRKKEQAEKKKQAFLRKFKKLSYTDKVKLAYCSNELEWDQKNELRNALNPNRDLSFIWPDGDKIRTSQDITVNLKDASLLLKAWKAGKLKHGQTIDRYTVLNVSPDFVKVGCHKIPTKNLSELCRELNI